MKCPRCESTHIRKNGHRQAKQNYICVDCKRQFLDQYDVRGYSDDVKQLCLKMYVNGVGVRSISRITEISHVTILNWIEQAGKTLPDSYDPKQIPKWGNLMNSKLSWAASNTRFGFGRQSITFNLEF